MPEEYFDIAYINFDKAILHGRIMDTSGGQRVERNLEQVLTDEQKRQIEDLNFAHQQEMDRLLSSFVNRGAA